jgi:hyperosmotically inducible protein
MCKKSILFLFALLAIICLTACDKMSQQSNDTIVTSKIITQYTTDPMLEIFQIKVATNQGVVTLSGNVNSDREAERAVMIAQATKGVTKIDTTNLKTKSGKTPILDTYITAKIKGLLLQQDIVTGLDFKSWNISVMTKNQVVYLTGKVSDKSIQDKVIELAKSVNDVKKVKDDIKVV